MEGLLKLGSLGASFELRSSGGCRNFRDFIIQFRFRIFRFIGSRSDVRV